MSVFYGASIHNANNNFHIQHLNQMDNIVFYDVKEVPFLTFKATFVTLPFILAIFISEIVILFRTKVRQVRNIALGALAAMAVALFCDLYVMSNAKELDFSRWGFIWIFMGFLSLGGNLLSWFINRRYVAVE